MPRRAAAVRARRKGQAGDVPCWHIGRVQDRYAGDLGDFLKFGLLRRLVPPGMPGPLRLGVVWYRAADEAHNSDGKYVSYLDPGHRSSDRFRALDPDLYERLARVVAGRRSTAGLADAGVLGPGTCFFGDLYSFGELSHCVLNVEFHGYHSVRWSALPVTLPSQWFGFSLVEQAIDRGAVIVLTRAAREWRVAVPGLASYPRLARAKAAAWA